MENKSTKLIAIVGTIILLLQIFNMVQLQALTKTGSYYLDVPIPIYSYYVGKFGNGTYYAINGSDWRMFTHGSDAQAIIQTCIDETTAQDGGTVGLAAATFEIDSTLNISYAVYLRGEGPHATILQASNSAADPIVSLDDSYTSLENLKVDGNWLYVSGVHFAQHYNEVYVWMRDVRVINCNKTAVFIGPSGWWSRVQNCWIQGNNATGITINMTHQWAGYYPVISDTLIKMNTGHNVHLVQTDKWGPVILHNCVIEFAGRIQDGSGGYVEAWGVYVEKHPIHIEECAIENNYYGNEYAIYIGEVSSPDTANSKIISCDAVGNIKINYAHFTIIRDVTLRGSCGLNITANADNTYVCNVVKRTGVENITNDGASTILDGWNAP